MKILSILTISATILTGSIAQANSVREVFDSFSSGNPGVYKTSRATHLYGGNITARIHQPQQQDFVGFTPPSLKSGCGGIDFYAGGFSMISGDEVVQMARGIAQGAAPYFFNLAVSSICPSCSTTMENLSDRLNEINQFAKTSCEQFYQKLDQTTDWSNAAESTRTTEVAMFDQRLGLTNWVDTVIGQGDNNRGSQAAKSLANANLSYSLFDAVIQNSTFSSGNFFSGAETFKETLMSLTGTGVADNSGDALIITSMPSEINPMHLIFGNDNPDLYTFKRLHCPEPVTTDPDCLKVTSVDDSMVPLYTQYYKLLAGPSGILEKLLAKKTMTSEQVAFMTSVDFPYVALAINAKEDGRLTDIARYVALRASYMRTTELYRLATHYLGLTQQMTWKNSKIAKKATDQYLEHLAVQLEHLDHNYRNRIDELTTHMAIFRQATAYQKQQVENRRRFD